MRKPFGQRLNMDKEIERQIEEVSSSAVEFRKSIDRIVFSRLNDFFKSRGKQISRESKVEDLFDKKHVDKDWYELNEIGMRIPGLRRHKAFTYLTILYLVTAAVTWTILLVKNLEVLIVIWGLPIVAPITLTLIPYMLLMFVFKKRVIPADTVDNLVDSIISKNWTDLLTDDKRLFKEILKEDLETGGRASA